ncbi:hypothetical protein EJ04DRAFT_139049 [Polyplosphaeria fusca]|uniref:Uncharacterized protein n=1 Tax=Polyplosphaeria fusca TaxID=682080 RepID=A0A9P4V615_9PLEO|nr:hypothetical protein EJ04DRAFT_139049 [Polyplosphaeria fusca]
MREVKPGAGRLHYTFFPHCIPMLSETTPMPCVSPRVESSFLKPCPQARLPQISNTLLLLLKDSWPKAASPCARIIRCETRQLGGACSSYGPHRASKFQQGAPYICEADPTLEKTPWHVAEEHSNRHKNKEHNAFNAALHGWCEFWKVDTSIVRPSYKPDVPLDGQPGAAAPTVLCRLLRTFSCWDKMISLMDHVNAYPGTLAKAYERKSSRTRSAPIARPPNLLY